MRASEGRFEAPPTDASKGPRVGGEAVARSAPLWRQGLLRGSCKQEVPTGGQPLPQVAAEQVRRMGRILSPAGPREAACSPSPVLPSIPGAGGSRRRGSISPPWRLQLVLWSRKRCTRLTNIRAVSQGGLRNLNCVNGWQEEMMLPPPCPRRWGGEVT